MKNKTTLYHFIVDRSGSMYSEKEQVIQSFNAQLKTIKSMEAEYPEQKILTSMTVFNSRVEHLSFAEESSSLAYLRPSSYKPDGTTALFDAFGGSVRRIEDAFGEKISKGEMSVVLYLLTDGLENASFQYSEGDIDEILQRLRKEENWSFSFLGADLSFSDISRNLKLRPTEYHGFDKGNFYSMSNDMSSSIRLYMQSKIEGRIRKDLMNEEHDNN